MLANVVGSYLDSLEEREFDAPFMALLRPQGFWDIHLLHGPFQIFKDFIGKSELPRNPISICLPNKSR